MKFLKYILQFLLVGFVVFIVYWFIAYWFYNQTPPGWTGFGERVKDSNIESAKTLFDWLRIVILPLSLALLGWIYKESEKAKQNLKEVEKNKKAAYQSFIDKIYGLIKDHNLSTNPTTDTRALAFNYLNNALSELDNLMKGQLVQFLYQCNLIDSDPKLRLVGANFSPTNMDAIILTSAEIRGAYFSDSSIKNAKLSHACFNSCDFSNTDFSGSTVDNTDFSYSKMNGVKLINMDLRSVNFEGVELEKADLTGSKITQVQLDSIFNKNGIKIKKAIII